MECGAIRGNGCPQALKPNWKYCPRCGSLTARLEVERVQSVSMAPGQGAPRQVKVRHGGFRGVPIDASLKESDGAFELLRPEPVVAHDVALVLNVAPLASGARADCVVRLRAKDGERDEARLWEPEIERTIDVEVTARAAQNAQLTLEPATAILHPDLPSRPIRILNQGGTSQHVDRVRATEGFEFRGVRLGDFVLHPGAEESLTVVAGPSAPAEGKLELLGPDGIPVATLPLICLPPPPPALKPRFIVGIDFGTSNTSVVVRDTERETVQFLGDEERFPTVIYCRSANPSEWFYGRDAIREYNETTEQGAIVWELKSFLRKDEEPCPGIAPKQDLLTWYFRELLEGQILPYLAEASEGVRTRVQFVFSLPVLDGGEQYARQTELTRAAWEEAGFLEHGPVQSEVEPVCAALYLLNEQRAGHLAVDLDDGDRILVFDSGGGTTDIAMATVRLRAGRLSLEEPQEIGAHRTASGETKQFGGTVVTHDMGKLLVDPREPGRYLRILARWNASQRSDYAMFDESNRKYFEEPLPPVQEPSDWHRRFPPLYELIEGAKRELAVDPDPLSKRKLFEVEDADTHEMIDVDATRPQLDAAIDHRMKPALESMFSQLRSEAGGRPPRIKYVFAVGGNCCVPRVTEVHLAGRFNRQQLVELSTEERFRTVPAGTVFAISPEVKTLPYSIEVQYEDETLAASFGEGSRRAVMAWAEPLQLRQGQRYRLGVRARLGGRIVPLATLELTNPSADGRQIKLFAKVQRLGERSVFVAGFEGATGEQEVFRYDV